jgi:RNAse (barnase) inhibitor barstar
MMRPTDLKKELIVSVHFIRPDELKAGLDPIGLKVFEGSVADIKTDKDLFSVVASAMQFPDYFGSNWDALDECLIDMNWLPADGYLLFLRDADKGWSQNPYILGRFVTTWLEASKYWIEEKKPFHLVFVMSV